MISISQDTGGIDGRDKEAAIYSHGGTNLGESENSFSPGGIHFLYQKPIYEDAPEKLDVDYRSTAVTGEVPGDDTAPSEQLVRLLNDAIGLIDQVLDVYEDEIERLNTFSLIDEKIKSLWELRDEANNNFVEVLVLLEVAVKNSRYRNYRENQYKSIKDVLEQIRDVFITPQKVKECRTILMDNGIDLFAPIRNWEEYTIEIKKINANT